MKSSNYKKNIFPLFFLIFKFTREGMKLPKRFWHHSMCFRIMHILSKFQMFILIFTVVKLKNKQLKKWISLIWIFYYSFIFLALEGILELWNLWYQTEFQLATIYSLFSLSKCKRTKLKRPKTEQRRTKLQVQKWSTKFSSSSSSWSSKISDIRLNFDSVPFILYFPYQSAEGPS